MSKAKSDKKADSGFQIVTRNRRARHEYDILDDLECGIVLTGSEVKSIRNGKISIEEAYARVRDGELWLVGADVAEYPQATIRNHEPKRPRKLLARKQELQKFAAAAEQQGFTLVPLEVYFRRGIVKVKIAVARGRKLHDKREKLRRETAGKEIRQAMLKRS